jgi:ribulose-phosphate 3-epimerase
MFSPDISHRGLRSGHSCSRPGHRRSRRVPAALEPRDRAFARNLIAYHLCAGSGQIDAHHRRPSVAQDWPPSRPQRFRHVIEAWGLRNCFSLGTASPMPRSTVPVGLVEGSALASFRRAGQRFAPPCFSRRSCHSCRAGRRPVSIHPSGSGNPGPRRMVRQGPALHCGSAIFANRRSMSVSRWNPESWATALGSFAAANGSLRRPAEFGGSGEALTRLYNHGRCVVGFKTAAPAAPGPVMLGNVSRVVDHRSLRAPGGTTMQLARPARASPRSIAPSRGCSGWPPISPPALAAELVAADATSWRPIAPADVGAPGCTMQLDRDHPAPSDIAWQSAGGRRPSRAVAGSIVAGRHHGETWRLLVYCVCSLQPEEGAPSRAIPGLVTIANRAAQSRRNPRLAAEPSPLKEPCAPASQFALRAAGTASMPPGCGGSRRNRASTWPPSLRGAHPYGVPRVMPPAHSAVSDRAHRFLAADSRDWAKRCAQIDKAGADIHPCRCDGWTFVPNSRSARSSCRRSVPFEAAFRCPSHDLAGRCLRAGVCRCRRDIITVHAEAGPHLHRTIQLVKSLASSGRWAQSGDPGRSCPPCFGRGGPRAGDERQSRFGGQHFITASTRQGKNSKTHDRESGRTIALEIDGGINEETATRAVAAGADVLSPARPSSPVRQSL